MDLNLQGKPVIVTGGCSGIGAALSLRLAHEGAVPVLPDRHRPAEALESARLRAQPRARFFQLELSDEAACAAAVQAAAGVSAAYMARSTTPASTTAWAWKPVARPSSRRSTAT